MGRARQCSKRVVAQELRLFLICWHLQQELRSRWNLSPCRSALSISQVHGKPWVVAGRNRWTKIHALAIWANILRMCATESFYGSRYGPASLSTVSVTVGAEVNVARLLGCCGSCSALSFLGSTVTQ